jgi:hypothetical protein
LEIHRGHDFGALQIVCTICMCWYFLLCVSQFSLVQSTAVVSTCGLPLSSNWVRMWDREKWLTQHFIRRLALKYGSCTARQILISMTGGVYLQDIRVRETFSAKDCWRVLHNF